MANTLGPLSAGSANAAQIADAAVSIWGAVHAALSAVIGQRGVAALYKRSLHVACTDYPWLAAAYEGALQPGDFTSLHAALAQQDAAIAAAAHDATMQILHDVLANLIGLSLTDRLLQAVWDHSSAGNAVKDASQ